MTERRNQARGANEWADTYGGLGLAAPVQLTQLPLHILDPWVDAAGRTQPFKPYSPKRLAELADNIRDNGIIEPICVRPMPNGRFQIIGGHNRVNASRMAGLTVVPALVRQLDDRQAWKLMIFSNLKHRPFLLPSEKAHAYAELMKDLRHQGQRTDLTSDNHCPKLPGEETAANLTSDNDCPKLESGWSHQVLAEQHGVSATSIKQHLRLLELQSELLDMVDNGAREKEDQESGILPMTFVAGYELSFLSMTEQSAALAIIHKTGKVPTPAQAKMMHKQSKERSLDESAIHDILQPVKAAKPLKATVKLPAERIASFFPQNTPPEQMEAEIYEALAFYRKHNTPASA